ncbi:DnaA regulatory inactivator Hda [Colwellia sp. MEBiC06753]
MKQDAQLALSVQLPDDETFDSFKGQTNASVAKILADFVDSAQTSGQTNNDVNSFYLFGGSGTGKSHLLHSATTLADSLGRSSLCLAMSDLTELSVEVLEGLEHIDLICIDDIQLLSGKPLWQQAVFDLFNRIKEQGKQVIFSGSEAVNTLPIELPDLKSRLSWGLTEQLKQLDETEKMDIVSFRALKRGLTIQPEVLKYLFNHFSRDMNELIEYLDTLDRLSIREQRKITIPFVKEALKHRE